MPICMSSSCIFFPVLLQGIGLMQLLWCPFSSTSTCDGDSWFVTEPYFISASRRFQALYLCCHSRFFQRLVIMSLWILEGSSSSWVFIIKPSCITAEFIIRPLSILFNNYQLQFSLLFHYLFDHTNGQRIAISFPRHLSKLTKHCIQDIFPKNDMPLEISSKCSGWLR